MLVYWDRKQTLNPRVHLRSARGAGALDFLIASGEVESGVADALWPERDSENETSRTLRRLSLAVAHAFLASGPAPGIDLPFDLPPRVHVGIPEGYAYYCLYPETYASAAKVFVDVRGTVSIGVVGVRNIGSSLSAVVAAALERTGCRVSTWTVRPHGHPFDRRLSLTPELERTWREAPVDYWAIVDEGPGLSGSSITSVASYLSGLGIPDDRIAFFPSWEPSGDQFVSEAARRRWQRHAKYTGSWKAPFVAGDSLIELSAGAWRSHVFKSEDQWPAAQPQHERRKFLDGETKLWKFEGLGRFGKQKLERAESLWKVGFGPRPLGFDGGFLQMEWLPGPRASLSDAGDPDLVQTVGRYLGYLAHEWSVSDGASSDLLREMIRVNTGREWTQAIPAARSCVIDGRLMPHEWVRTPSGYRKTDCLHHHDDHFLAGPQGIGWDVAGASIEMALGAEATHTLARACGVPETDLAFWRTAYTAFRLGYCELAARALAGTPEETRFRSASARYGRALPRA
ncbi:MAG TPA: hypothetical protein VN428_09630 [Bryobacteraceae bacterium]|nr:hypothetical protein [Bryobacteraceae bacterium]